MRSPTSAASMILGLSFLTSACSPLGSTSQSVAFGGKSLSTPTTVAAEDPLSCLNTKVDYLLNTSVLDFEMTGGGGLTVGYSPVGSTLLGGISLGVNYSTGQLQTEMQIFDPMQPGVQLTSALGSASNNNLSFSLDANIAMAQIGPSFWYSTPIYNLSNSALQNNLANVVSNLNTLVQTPWWSSISELNGSAGFFIPVGTNAGIEVGDEFNVMNVTYEWAGDGVPCQNALVMPLVNSTTPKAVAKAQTVGVDYAYLAYVSNSGGTVALHDYVTPASLVQPVAQACTNFLGIGCPAAPAARTTLARSVSLGTLTVHPLTFVGQNNSTQTLDITPFVNAQLGTLIPASGSLYVAP